MPPWAWSILVREFGPKHAPTRLVLFAMPTWMGKSGEDCFPAMETMAGATQLSLRAVKAAVDRARREAWLAAWKVPGIKGAYPHNYYVACIPDWVDLDAFDARRSDKVARDRKFAALADSWSAQWGDAPDELHDRPRPKPRARTKLSAPDNSDLVQVIPQPSAPGDINSVHALHSKSPSEVSIQVSKEQGPALTRATDVYGECREQKSEPEVRQRKGRTVSAGLKVIATLIAGGEGPETALYHAQRMQYPVTIDDLRKHLMQRGAA